MENAEDASITQAVSKIILQHPESPVLTLTYRLTV